MTLSSEVLPAPFGPMIARISCRRIARLTPLSACTPPNERLISSASRIGSPMCFRPRRRASGDGFLAGDRGSAAARPRGIGTVATVADREVGAHHALAAVLERHLGLDMARAASEYSASIRRRVALGDDAAAHLAGAGQLAVVGVELLVQDQEPVDLRRREVRLGGEIAVGLRDAAGDQLVDLLGRAASSW